MKGIVCAQNPLREGEELLQHMIQNVFFIKVSPVSIWDVDFEMLGGGLDRGSTRDPGRAFGCYYGVRVQRYYDSIICMRHNTPLLH